MTQRVIEANQLLTCTTQVHVVPGTGLEGAVDWDQVVVGSQAVAVGVHVGEQLALWQGGKGGME